LPKIENIIPTYAYLRDQNIDRLRFQERIEGFDRLKSTYPLQVGIFTRLLNSEQAQRTAVDTCYSRDHRINLNCSTARATWVWDVTKEFATDTRFAANSLKIP